MDRPFLDANVLFSIAYDPSARIAQLLELPDVQLVTSRYAVAEALRNIDVKSPKQLGELSDLFRSEATCPIHFSRLLWNKSSCPGDFAPLFR